MRPSGKKPKPAKRLRLRLLHDWADITDRDKGGPLTAAWDAPAATGALQFSTAEHSSGPEPRPTAEDLVDMAKSFGLEHGLGEPTATESGPCAMGTFGTAVFRCEDPTVCQVWFLSNGLDFVFVTFTAMQEPLEKELKDAQSIIEAIELS